MRYALSLVLYLAAYSCVSFADPASPSATESKLLGKHMFGVQFIESGYGTAIISNDSGGLTISGTQQSKHNGDFCKISGQLSMIDEHKLMFKGTINSNINSCCGHVEKTGEFIFLRSGKRKFWRLQKSELFCDPYKKCAYYIDIFL
ncbi:MAG: hypothetical protein HY080_17765 [Gammaproteobacteria bacterium]|nr:hypothetical protein [Gammaproteobacteria bacterium]